MQLWIVVTTLNEQRDGKNTGRVIPYVSLSRGGRVANAWRGTPLEDEDQAYEKAKEILKEKLPDVAKNLD